MKRKHLEMLSFCENIHFHDSTANQNLFVFQIINDEFMVEISKIQTKYNRTVKSKMNGS